MRLLFVASLLLLLTVPGWAESNGSSEGVFVAVGDRGRRVSSTDGVTWTNDFRWNDAFEATSPRATSGWITWTKDLRLHDGTFGSDDGLFDVAFGAGKFVAVGGGPRTGHILNTRDGREWHVLPDLEGAVTTVAFGHGKFVAGHGGALLSSSDGEKFTPGQRLDWKGSIRALRSACGDTEAGYRFVIIGDVDLQAEKKRIPWRAVTEDGSTYQHSSLETPAAADIAYGSGHFVVVGPAGLIESSHDGQAWERHAAPSTENFTRVIWTGSRFVISGGMYVWTSPDGLNWKKEGYPFPAKAFWGREGFLFLGLGFKDRSEIFYSHDFTSWMVGKLPPGPAFNAIAFGQLVP